MKWFELLNDTDVIAKAKQSFKDHNGYDYSPDCAGDALGQRLDDAQFGTYKTFWAKEKAKEMQSNVKARYHR